MASAKKNILLVEDDAMIALSESKDLEGAGYSVLRSLTGEKAVELVSRNSSAVDLILMDIDLGKGIDGTEAARRILRICDIPILFLSSHIEPEIVRKTEEITNYGYVVKASLFTVLDASIKMAFKLFTVRRQLDLSNTELKKALGKLEGSASAGQVSDLWEKQERYRLAMEATTDGLWDRDIRTGGVYYSPAYYTMLGYGENEFPSNGDGWLEYIHPDDRPMAQKANSDCVENLFDSFSIEFRMRTKDGAWKWINSRGKAVGRDATGRAMRLVGTHIDITAQIEAEQERELASERFRAIVENTPDHILIQDGDLRYTMVINPQLGLTEAGMLGKTDMEILSSEDAARLTEVKRRMLESGVPVHFEAPLANTKGDLEYFDGSYIPKFDASGKANGLIGYFRNVTEEHANRIEIERLVAEKEILVREMRHRVLNNLQTLASYLSLQLSSTKNEDAALILKCSISQTRGMQLLFDKLYRPESGGSISMSIYLPDLVSEIIDTFGTPPEVKTTVAIDDIMIDRTRLAALGIIVNELVTNSMKYAFHETAQPVISLSASLAGNRVRIAYGDNGGGLPAQFSVLTNKGFGFTLIDGLVKQLGGTLSVGSDHGARFEIEFEL